MTALVISWLIVVAASWLMATESGAGLTVAYGLAGLALLARLTWAALQRPRVSRARLTSWVVASLPVLWYVGMVLVEPLESAARRHQAEIVGAVMPGWVLGMLAAAAVTWRAQDPFAPDRIVAARWSALGVLVLATTATLLAAFLFGNAEEGILLVSTSLLAGAETYQILGDALTVAVLLSFTLSSMDAHTLGGRGWPARLHRVALPAHCVATFACAVLIGSNKLLLISVLVGAIVGWRMLLGNRRSARRRAVIWGAMAVLTLGLLLLAVNSEVVGEVLALTRLLDYGNVESLLDTPSVAARAEIFDGCGARQLQMAPWFGDLAAEFKTCGDGYYIHSLISIQTHLGLAGSVLFIVALARGGWVISSTVLYRALWVPFWLVMGIGFVGAYFTWLPFWFLMGLLTALYRTDAPATNAS